MARRGLILPLDWRLGEGLTLHYLTAEVTEMIRSADEIRLNVVPERFRAEMSLPPGWEVEGARLLAHDPSAGRVQVEGEGALRLCWNAANKSR